MYVFIAGILVLVCVSLVQLIWNYKQGEHPVELVEKMPKCIQNNIGWAVRESTHNVGLGLAGLFGWLIILAYPITYILATLFSYIYRAYCTFLRR